MKALLERYLNRNDQDIKPEFQNRIQTYNYDGHICHIWYDDPLEHGIQYAGIPIWEFLEWCFFQGLLNNSKTDIS